MLRNMAVALCSVSLVACGGGGGGSSSGGSQAAAGSCLSAEYVTSKEDYGSLGINTNYFLRIHNKCSFHVAANWCLKANGQIPAQFTSPMRYCGAPMVTFVDEVDTIPVAGNGFYDHLVFQHWPSTKQEEVTAFSKAEAIVTGHNAEYACQASWNGLTIAYNFNNCYNKREIEEITKE